MKIQFIGGSYQGKSTNVNSQVCKNLFPVVNKEGGKEPLSIMGTPGLSVYMDLVPKDYFLDSDGKYVSPSGSDFLLVIQ